MYNVCLCDILPENHTKSIAHDHLSQQVINTATVDTATGTKFKLDEKRIHGHDDG